MRGSQDGWEPRLNDPIVEARTSSGYGSRDELWRSISSLREAFLRWRKEREDSETPRSLN